MCNRAQASIKALQILGNSVRGISFTQWRLVFNAVCLLVLTYGCQLWYTGKQVPLVLKLQRVQNEAVRVISGSFSMAPRDPLHQILSIHPMDLRLNMLTLSSALRLYRLPHNSQPLKCLSGPWSEHSEHDLPIPAPPCKATKTALKWLASHIPSNGPCIEAFPPTPPTAPLWNRCLTIHPEGVEAATASPEQDLVRIFCLSILTSTGSPSGKPRGTTATLLYTGNIAWGLSMTCLGKTVTKFNSQLAAFQPALSLMELFLKINNHHGHILILNDTKAMVSKITDTRPGPDQPTTLETMWLIDHSLSNHTDCSFQLSWFNRREAQDAYNWAKFLVLNAIKDPLNPSLKPLYINFQCEQVKAITTRKWEECWHTNPCTSLAYCTACTKPPDGQPHPILQAQQQD